MFENLLKAYCFAILLLEDVDFRDNSGDFGDVMQPFLRSPLRHLGLDNCREVPESFCNWFDPNLGNWPSLETLSLAGLETTCGPGDDMG